MKERDTVIISVRVKKNIIPEMLAAIKKSRKPSRNAWLNWAISIGLRKHIRTVPEPPQSKISQVNQ